MRIEVVSDRNRYGHLVAIRSAGGSFEPLERSILESYARLAACALDSEASIVDARQQATTAQALLALSSSLADLASTEEMINCGWPTPCLRSSTVTMWSSR